MSTGLTVAAIVLSIPLMLVGIRVLGETNWGPISALTNMKQGIFAALARILSEGVKALPTGALQALLVGVAVGVLLTFLESNPRWRKWVPSPTGIGIGMLVPGSAVCAMFVGASLGELWRMAKSRNYTL